MSHAHSWRVVHPSEQAASLMPCSERHQDATGTVCDGEAQDVLLLLECLLKSLVLSCKTLLCDSHFNQLCQIQSNFGQLIRLNIARRYLQNLFLHSSADVLDA